MKLAIATFHNKMSEHTIGGICTGPIYLAENFRNLGAKVDILALCKKGKDSAFEGQVTYVPTEDTVSTLNTYDAIIFMAPGYTYEKFYEETLGSNYDYALKGLTTPFSFIVNEETDRKLYPYHSEFINHEMCKFVIFNSEGMSVDFPDFLPNGKPYIEFNFYVQLPSLVEILTKASTKKDIIMSTARWNNRKRVLELVELSEEIHSKGIKVKVAGAQQNYFCAKRILELESEYWERVGYYTPDMLPEMLDDVKYHYNFVFLKRQIKSRPMRPRIEISTLEAFREGCLPVICRDLMPSWLGDKSALALPSSELSRLPEILSEMTDEERLDRIQNFYNDIQEHVVPTYSRILEMFNE